MSQCEAWKFSRPGSSFDEIYYCVRDAGHSLPHRDHVGSVDGDWRTDGVPKRSSRVAVLPAEPPAEWREAMRAEILREMQFYNCEPQQTRRLMAGAFACAAYAALREKVGT